MNGERIAVALERIADALERRGVDVPREVEALRVLGLEAGATPAPPPAIGRGRVEHTTSGRYCARLEVDGRSRSLGTFDDDTEAHAALSAFRRDVAQSAAAGLGGHVVTLGAFGGEWVRRREVDGSRARVVVKGSKAEQSVWDRHVAKAEIAAVPLVTVTAAHVEAFARWLSTREAVDAARGPEGSTVYRPTGRVLSRATQGHALRLVRQALEDAVRRGIIDTNPAEKVRLRIGEGASRDLADDWLRPVEVGRLLSCGEISIRDRTVYACAIGLGLRLADLKALTVDDVRLDDGAPHVRIKIRKTGKWHRVPILPWLDPWLRCHLEALRADQRLLFGRPNGQPYGRDYDYRWAESRRRRGGVAVVTRPSALERAGIDRKIRFHDLRGTAATCLAIGAWGKRWALFDIQQMLAHADQRVTERYVRRALDSLAAVAAETTEGPDAGLDG